MNELVAIELGCIFPAIQIQYQPIHEHKDIAIAHIDSTQRVEWARQLVSNAVNRWLYNGEAE